MPLLEQTFYDMFNILRSQLKAAPLYLGGAAGINGGIGGPPGGFIGTLPQTKVSYDLSELAVNEIPASGYTLLDNLNRIRYRISQIEASGIGGSSSLSIRENGTEIATGVTVINFIGADVSPITNGVNVTISGGTGGGGSTNLWNPDLPPSSPNAMDDEFNDESFNTTLWTEFNPGNHSFTRSEVAWGGLTITNNSNNNIFGYCQLAPSSPYSIISKIRVSDFHSGDIKPAIMLLEGTLSTSKVLMAGLSSGGYGHAIQIEYYNAYNSYNSALLNNSYNLPDEWGYIRVRVNGTTLNFDIGDGIAWKRRLNSTMAFTPAYVGLGFKSNNADGIAHFQFFRVLSGDTFNSPVYGRKG
jgi:hypothetical protein